MQSLHVMWKLNNINNKYGRWHHAPSHGQREPLAWDVTMQDTYAESHIKDTMTSPGLAADQAAQQKMDKYSKLLSSTHIFCPVAVETAGTWNGLAIELVQEIGRCITAITEDAREHAVFLFQRLSMALQQGNVVAFQNTMSTEWVAVAAVNTFL